MTGDSAVTQENQMKWRFSQALDRQLWRLETSGPKSWRSPARFGSLTAKWINAQDADLVNLHWVTDGFLSVEEIGRIEKPIVWSLCDLWPVAGTAHYFVGLGALDERAVLADSSRLGRLTRLDIDRWTQRRKIKHWLKLQHRILAVAASSWVADAVTQSPVTRSWPVAQIPHIVETDVFRPLPTHVAREKAHLNLDPTAQVLLFVSSAGVDDPRKGWDLLEQALDIAGREERRLNVIVAGPKPSDPRRKAIEGNRAIQFHWLNWISSDQDLANLYSAADVVAIPSRQDNLPLVALEAQSCGKPILAFDIGGMPDAVASGTSGYLAAAGDVVDLAHGISEALNLSRQPQISARIRERAQFLWSRESVVSQYFKVYERVLAS